MFHTWNLNDVTMISVASLLLPSSVQCASPPGAASFLIQIVAQKSHETYPISFTNQARLQQDQQFVRKTHETYRLARCNEIEYGVQHVDFKSIGETSCINICNIREKEDETFLISYCNIKNQAQKTFT
jgi:hypothetical protein